MPGFGLSRPARNRAASRVEARRAPNARREPRLTGQRRAVGAGLLVANPFGYSQPDDGERWRPRTTGCEVAWQQLSRRFQSAGNVSRSRGNSRELAHGSQNALDQTRQVSRRDRATDHEVLEFRLAKLE